MRFLLLLVLVGGTLACEQRLVRLVQESAGGAADLSTDVIYDCNAKVGTFPSAHLTKYKSMMNKALTMSMKYMAVSSNFGRDTIQRPGFQKLFRDASDERFQEAIDMIKYIVKRGGNIKGAIDVKLPAQPRFEPGTLPSLGMALSDTKAMYEEEENIHRDSLCLNQRASCSGIDGDLARRMQDAMSLEVDRANRMAALTNELAIMYTRTEHDLAEELFDQSLL